jgi:hypothetical protein
LNVTELHEFLSDDNLLDLMERVKISDDTLDVISLSETQHSSMLAWCIHPNEGHAQGDAVLKDFLIAAYRAGENTNKFSNKSFFEKWTPGRIRTSSFGSAFIAREFSLQTEDISKKRRLDLFIIDPRNQLVVTIENKAGATLNEQQLSGYYERVNEQIARRPVFRDYEFLYVVVDRDLDWYDDEYLLNLGNKWTLLDYSWLQSAAKRARLHMERNNEAAHLLMSYCQRQTGWQTPNERLISELSADLTSQHEAVAEAIRLLLKVRPTEWTPTSFSGHSGELLIFIQQNRQLCEQLVQARGIGSAHVGLRKALPELKQDDVELGRTWLRFSTSGMQSLMRGADGYWPLYINIFREANSDDETSKFTIRLIWHPEHFSDDAGDSEALRKHMATNYPGLSKFSNRPVRRLVLERKLNVKLAIKSAVELARDIDKLIASARKSGILF